MRKFGRNELVILLGAGASHDAGIPTSSGIIEKIESALQEDLSDYKELYHLIKSSIYYAEGLNGKFDSEVDFNIEKLVNTLRELSQRTQHPLYPFIGNWNQELLQVANHDFSKIKEFEDEILNRLKNEWIILEDPSYEDANYYKNLINLQKEFEHPLRIFSLNYDLCVERICGPRGNEGEVKLERGFDSTGEKKLWDWREFQESDTESPDIYLYKLHGSIDWREDEEHDLVPADQVAMIDNDELQIIFGTNYKLEYVDPFLFFAYEFRKWTLQTAKLIVSIGYGFSDDHINGILGQALRQDSEKRILSVSPRDKEEMEEKIKDRLNFEAQEKDQIVHCSKEAKQFMEEKLAITELEEFAYDKPDIFAEEIEQS